MIARLVAVLTVLALAACTAVGGGATPAGTTAPPTVPPTASPTAPGPTASPSAVPEPTATAPTAADSLAAFLTEAERLDAALRAAAVRITATVGVDVITVDATTADAVTAIDPLTALDLVPAGLSPDLLDPVLTVFSVLVSRRAAFNPFDHPGRLTTATDDYADARTCLGNGSAPAERFAGDLAALRELAARLPAVDVAAGDSRAAAELAVAGTWVVVGNNGCGSCGGGVVTRAPAIAWRVPPGAAPKAEGDVEGIAFTATYDATGWQVQLNAC